MVAIAAAPAALLAHYFAATILTLLTWWIERHCPIDSQRMEEHFHRLTASVR